MPTPSPLAPKNPIPGVTYDPLNPPGLQDRIKKLEEAGKKPVGATIPGLVETKNAITGLPDFFSKLSNVYLWQRVGIVVIGVFLIITAVSVFLSTNKPAQGALTKVSKKVIKGTPQGAAANLLTGSLTA